jgi:hypothetical protein
MGKKKSGSSASRQSASAGSTVATKTPRARKPPMERAQALIQLAVAKLAALAKLSAGWQEEVNSDVAVMGAGALCERIAINLRSALSMSNQIAADVKNAADTGFSPKAGSPGRKGLAACDLVKIKEAKFDVKMHGDDNHFEVVTTSEKNVLIKGMVSGASFPVPRAWLEADKVATEVATEVGSLSSGSCERWRLGEES